MADPYALNEDGTAKDPAAFQKAVREDPAKMEELEKDPEVAKIVLGEDTSAFQELIKNVFQVTAAQWAVRLMHAVGFSPGGAEAVQRNPALCTIAFGI